MRQHIMKQGLLISSHVEGLQHGRERRLAG